MKKALLPLLTWPAHQALRCAGYYRPNTEIARGSRILVALYGGIGNVVLATPMLQAIHRGFPESVLHVWCQVRPSAEICRTIPYVERVLIDGGASVSSDYDIFVVNCVAPPLRASLFGLNSGASLMVGEDSTKSHLGFLFNCCGVADVSAHEVDRNLGILRRIGLRPLQARPFINIGEEHRIASREFLRDGGLSGRPVVGLHPGSGPAQSFKRWRRSKFAELARRLCEDHGVTVLLFGGEDEIELAEAIADESGCGHVVAGRLSILETAALIEQCKLFISNDSGLMHIAAAVGTPTIGIFGPTRPEKNRPYGTDHLVVTAGMRCQPCYSTESTIKCSDPLPCMEAIRVEHVLSAAAGALTKPDSSTISAACALHVA